MTVLHASDLGARHRYLARALPSWSKSMASIRAQGGPWSCPHGCVSYLVYRCSVCGKELSGE